MTFSKLTIAFSLLELYDRIQTALMIHVVFHFNNTSVSLNDN